MTSMIYIASNAPLPARRNPYWQTLSVNQALAQETIPIPAFMLADNFDRDKPDVLLWYNDTVLVDAENDFAISPEDKPIEIISDKPYWAVLEGNLSAKVIDYLRMQLKKSTDLELWHIWLDGEIHYRIRRRQIAIHDLTSQDLQRLAHQPVWATPPDSDDTWEEPSINYYYHITR